jgi:hypothetical protein
MLLTFIFRDLCETEILGSLNEVIIFFPVLMIQPNYIMVLTVDR